MRRKPWNRLLIIIDFRHRHPFSGFRFSCIPYPILEKVKRRRTSNVSRHKILLAPFVERSISQGLPLSRSQTSVGSRMSKCLTVGDLGTRFGLPSTAILNLPAKTLGTRLSRIQSHQAFRPVVGHLERF